MAYEQGHEKKGMMEKIKEKLPGHHGGEEKHQSQEYGTTGTYGTGSGMGTEYATGTGMGHTGMGHTGMGTGTTTVVGEPYAQGMGGTYAGEQIPSGMRKTRRGKLRREGSSSSSSSDDDERRTAEGGQKKGLMGKIKDKLPGGHKDADPAHQGGNYGATGTGYGTGTGTGYGTGTGTGTY